MKKRIQVLMIGLVVMVASIISMSTNASAKVTYDKEQVLYILDSNNKEPSQGRILLQCTKSSEKIKKSTMRISDSSVAEFISLVRSTQKNEIQFWGDYDQDQAYANYTYSMDMRLMKPGKTKVSFKIGNKKHTVNLTVKKYTNPIKKLTITGVKGGKNIASKFSKNSQCLDLSVTKKANNAVINVTANKNWKVIGVGLLDNKNNESYVYDKRGAVGKTKVKLPVGALKTKGRYDVYIRLRHKNGGIINCNMILR